MALRPLIGHDTLRARLSQSVASNRLPSSILLQGPRGVGKQRLALWLGQLLLCEVAQRDRLAEPCGECRHCRYCERVQHPDLHWFFPRPRLKDGDPGADDVKADLAEAIAERMEADGLWSPPSGTEALYVATIRALVNQASLRPAMATRSVFVVGDAERMVAQEGSEQAANAFLKLLEEPPPATTIIITSSEPGALLPTIRSRVVTVRVNPLRPSEVIDFIRDPAVQRKLAGTSEEQLVQRAGGAPGELLAASLSDAAFSNAARILDAALAAGGPAGIAERMRVATRQGVAGARGAFSDTLDALTILLHRRMRDLALRPADDGSAARRTSAAIIAVEEIRIRAQGNVNPQLLTASLLGSLHQTLRP